MVYNPPMAFVDGSVVNGRTVVILTVPSALTHAPEEESTSASAAGAAGSASSGSGLQGGGAPRTGTTPVLAPGPALSAIHAPSKAQFAEAQAASLESAAAVGAPLCADCQQANEQLAQAEKSAW
jgi:hypothetical protein